MSANKLLQAAAGNAGGSVYVEDVFSTFLYHGNQTARSINNGLDLSGEGGLVWLKSRGQGQSNYLFDTENGANKFLVTTSTAALQNVSDRGVTAFNSNGFDLGTNTGGNRSGYDYVSWSFRKQEGFFDVVTWTGNGTAGNTVSHNLGSAPGCIIAKRTDTSGDSWAVYHRSLGGTYYAPLNGLEPFYLNSNRWNGATASATEFTVGSSSAVNASGGTYVAYLFAHDDQQFGDDSDESIIKCGSYSGTGGSSSTSVNLGFEPQFVFIMNATYGTYNLIYDSMRGIYSGSNDPMLHANSSNAEDATFGSSNDLINLDPTGFTIKASGYDVTDRSGSTFVYIAIRRPMKTPESASDVFSVYGYSDTGLTSGSGTASNRTIINGGSNGGSGFPVDMFWHGKRSVNSYGWSILDRLRGKGKSLITNTNDDEPAGDGASNGGFDFQEGVDVEYNGEFYYYNTAAGGRTHISYFFKRAAGFFDEVCYTGNGSSQTINHNLGVVPEFIIAKARNYDSNAHMMHINAPSGEGMRMQGQVSGSSYYMLNDAVWGNAVTSSAITFKNSNNVTRSGYNFVCWMFASISGVSKCGSYTGTGSDVNVDCGFSAGARMVLIRRADDSGSTYVWDSTRGIVAGNDPYLLFESGAEQTSYDYIDPLNAGFTVTSSAPAALNASGGTYIFLAIA